MRIADPACYVDEVLYASCLLTVAFSEVYPRASVGCHSGAHTQSYVESTSMPCPIIEISELTQLIADHLLLDDQQALVSLACTCRALRIQALATLWSEQSSLGILIKCTLSPDILSYSPSLPQVCSSVSCPACF